MNITAPIKKIIFFLSLFCLLIGNTSPVKAGNATSFGVSPGYLQNDILLRGSKFEQEFIISRANPETDSEAIIEVEKSTVSDWIIFDPGLTIKLPKGQQRVPIKAIVKVPDQVELGEYLGTIRITEKRPSSETLSFQPSVKLVARFVITNSPKREFRITFADIKDFYSTDPLNISYIISNTGNEPVKLSKIKVEIKNIHGQVLKVFESDNLEEFPEFSSKELNQPIYDHGLTAGNYIAVITFFDGDVSSYSNEVNFTVVEKDTASVKNVSKSEGGTSEINYSYFLCLGVILIFLLLVIFMRRRSEQKKKKVIEAKKILQKKRILDKIKPTEEDSEKKS